MRGRPNPSARNLTTPAATTITTTAQNHGDAGWNREADASLRTGPSAIWVSDASTRLLGQSRARPCPRRRPTHLTDQGYPRFPLAEGRAFTYHGWRLTSSTVPTLRSRRGRAGV